MIMKQKRNRTILSGILFILLLVVTLGATFAYWAGTIKAPEDKTGVGSVIVGVAEDVDTTLTIGVSSLSTQKELVPFGYTNENTVSTLDIDFTDVLWSGVGATGAVGEIVAEVTSFKIGGIEYKDVPAYYNLFTITLPIEEIIAGTNLVYKVTLTFANEPIDVEQYEKIADKTIEITFNFIVTPSLN